LDSEFVVVLTTFPADGDAEAFATTLVTEGLAACVNILPPMVSIYRWKGAVERANERQLVMKTTSAKVPALESRITALHSYDVPEFVVLPIVSGSPGYLSWLAED
jgi:periplasmic divalent cation tolerance protein